jgi:uncharacterized membrane protein SirB2
VDKLLLASAIALAVTTQQFSFVEAWLAEHVVFAYIVLIVASHDRMPFIC